MGLTKEQNQLLTQVGRGTPSGELLRRYWHPIAIARELTEESPTRFVRVLGEDLVLFQDKSVRKGVEGPAMITPLQTASTWNIHTWDVR